MNCRACMDPYILCHIFWITLLPLICPLAGNWFTTLPFRDNLQNPNLGPSESLQEGLCPWAYCILAHPHFLQHLVRAAAVVGISTSLTSRPKHKAVPKTQSLVALAEVTTTFFLYARSSITEMPHMGQWSHLWVAPHSHITMVAQLETNLGKWTHSFSAHSAATWRWHKECPRFKQSQPPLT